MEEGRALNPVFSLNFSSAGKGAFLTGKAKKCRRGGQENDLDPPPPLKAHSTHIKKVKCTAAISGDAIAVS